MTSRAGRSMMRRAVGVCGLVVLVVATSTGCDEVFRLHRPEPDAWIDGPLGAWGPLQGEPALPIGVADEPSLTADLLELYWNHVDGDVYRMVRASVSSSWAMSAPVAEVNSASVESTPEISGDGLTLGFASDRGNAPGNTDLWVSSRTARDQPWSAPVAIAELASSSAEKSPSLTADGLLIVFTSARSGRSGVWMASRSSVDVPWEAPIQIESLISTGNDLSSFVSADGLAVYFDRVDASFDLYVAQRASRSDPFGAPTAITEVNSPKEPDEDPWVSPDGHHLYFIRNAGEPTSQLLHATR